MENYSIQIVELPENEPVSVEELYDHLSLNVALEAIQDLLATYISAAREQFETLTDGRITSSTAFTQSIPAWPCGHPIRLMRGEVQAVTSVTYYDANDQLQTLNSWVLDKTGIPALVYLPDHDYPALSCSRPRPVSITFSAGMTSIPSSVKLAIMLLAAHYYNVREAFGQVNYAEVPMGFKTICNQWKTGLFGI